MGKATCLLDVAPRKRRVLCSDRQEREYEYREKLSMISAALHNRQILKEAAQEDEMS